MLLQSMRNALNALFLEMSVIGYFSIDFVLLPVLAADDALSIPTVYFPVLYIYIDSVVHILICAIGTPIYLCWYSEGRS